MNPRRIFIALALALLVSGTSTWLVSRSLKAAPIPASISEVGYAAPSRALQAGELLNSSNTEVVAWPASIPIDGAFSRTADLTGRSILFPLAKGQPIVDRDLATVGTGIGLANRIPDGMRAVALRSDEVVGVAGFLVPGSHLDVLVTYRPDGAAAALTATVVQNAVVIAAGHQTEPDPSGKIADVTVVTLLLTPGESQRAVLASTQGAIHFILRNGADSATERTRQFCFHNSRCNHLPGFIRRLRSLCRLLIPARRTGRSRRSWLVMCMLSQRKTEAVDNDSAILRSKACQCDCRLADMHLARR